MQCRWKYHKTTSTGTIQEMQDYLGSCPPSPALSPILLVPRPECNLDNKIESTMEWTYWRTFQCCNLPTACAVIWFYTSIITDSLIVKWTGNLSQFVSYKKSWTDIFLSCPTYVLPTWEMKRTRIPLSWSGLYHPNRKLAGEWRWGKLRRRREWKRRDAEILRCPWESRFWTPSLFRAAGGGWGGQPAGRRLCGLRFVPLFVGEEWARCDPVQPSFSFKVSFGRVWIILDPFYFQIWIEFEWFRVFDSNQMISKSGP
jgi:hypothetical protein